VVALNKLSRAALVLVIVAVGLALPGEVGAENV
jgi:hypothetical protein